MNFTKKGGILQEIKKVFWNFKEFWNTYNGFICMSMILGIAGFFLIFFGGGPAYYVDIIIFFSLNSIITFFGILYIIGFCLLLIYFIDRIFRIRGNSEKPVKTRSNFYIYLAFVIFLSFDILTYKYFIVLPFPFPQGEVWIFDGPHYYMPPSFYIGPGFIFSLVMTTMIIIGMIYDIIYNKMTLRQLYETYLPIYAPKKYQKLDEFYETY
ncbi:MAG TPA: hypothetical protein VMV49_03765 [Candidatus Deferrimicrobium sp.]|nr:hypothetical protein [Candidatus Deferrimicrobium sp.]